MSNKYKILKESVLTGSVTETYVEYIDSSATTLSLSGLSVDSLSATTYYGDGSNLTGVGGTFNGGVVTGFTQFTNGVQANSITATTYYGNGSNLTGISAEFTGGTVTGPTHFTNGLTSTSISATTYSGAGQNLTGVVPRSEFKSVRTLQASNATFSTIGISSSAAGTLTNGIDTDGMWTDITTANAAGNVAGLTSTSFSEFRTSFNPEFVAYIKTPATITTMRYWIGFVSATPTNTDNLAGSCIAFRYSTVAGDTGWRPVNDDGTTQTLGANIGTFQANTIYRLKIRVNSTTGLAYFSVNGGAEVAVGTLPANTVNLGYSAYVINTANGARALKIGRLQMIHN